MIDAPLVSIIVPFFNARKFLREAVESVLAQSYDNWELLLVDDGSTDGSSVIARQYAADDPGRVRYLEHDGHRNRGACAARNLGVGRARGDCIALLDADDVWLPHKLERQLAILAAAPGAAMVYGASQYWFSWSGQAEGSGRDYVREVGFQSGLVKPPKLLTLALRSQAPTPCPSNVLLRREIVERVGGFEQSFTGPSQLYEDQAFLAKIYVTAPVFVSTECWDRYRQHPDSCVSVAKRAGKKQALGLDYLNWLKSYLSRRAIDDRELWKALRHKRFRYRYPKLHRLVAEGEKRLLRTRAKNGAIGRRAMQNPHLFPPPRRGGG